MEAGAEDARSGPGLEAPRTKSRRLMLAIVGMILCVVLAVGIVLQEGGQVVQFDRHGHLYSPLLREMLGKHHKSHPSQPAAPSSGA